MTKNYKAAPLPFIGQKRLFLKDFKAMLAEIEYQNDAGHVCQQQIF